MAADLGLSVSWNYTSYSSATTSLVKKVSGSFPFGFFACSAPNARNRFVISSDRMRRGPSSSLLGSEVMPITFFTYTLLSDCCLAI